MHSTHVITVFASLLVALGLSVGVASAAPINAKTSELVELTCANGTAYTMVRNGNGVVTPGHILDAAGNTLVPVAFHFVVVNASGEVLFDRTIAKPGQMNGLSGDLLECTFILPGIHPVTGEPTTINGTVTLFETPRA